MASRIRSGCQLAETGTLRVHSTAGARPRGPNLLPRLSESRQRLRCDAGRPERPALGVRARDRPGCLGVVVGS